MYAGNTYQENHELIPVNAKYIPPENRMHVFCPPMHACDVCGPYVSLCIK